MCYILIIGHLTKADDMKLSNAIKKLKSEGWDIISNKGTYIAAKSDSEISFFVNPGSDKCSRFTFDSSNSCAPTYGMSLKAAIGQPVTKG